MNLRKIENKVILPSMTGITKPAFRNLCIKLGAELTFSECIDVERSLINGYLTGLAGQKIYLNKINGLNGVQLIDNNADRLKKMVKIVEPYCDVLELNFGCPIGWVMRLKKGAYFSSRPNEVNKLLSKIIKCTNKPIIAKFRIDSDFNNTIKFAKICDTLGLAAIHIHIRTIEDWFCSETDPKIFREIKDKIEIPIIGNGGIKNKKDICKFLNSGCDLVSVGQSSIYNPLIFSKRICISFFCSLLHYYLVDFLENHTLLLDINKQKDGLQYKLCVRLKYVMGILSRLKRKLIS